MGNACYCSIEKLLSSNVLSKNLKVRIYKIIILPVVLYGCETWTLTLRAEQRLWVFENKVLRKIFGAKRDEVTEEWRKLHNAELHALYCSPDIIRNVKSRRLRWAGHVARMSESRVLVWRPEGIRPLRRPKRGKYEPVLLDNAYKVHMKLTIKSVAPSDFGSYKCVSKNSLGDTDGSIKLYQRQTQRSYFKTESHEEYFRLLIFLLFLDYFISQLKDRCLNHKGILMSIQTFLPKNIVRASDEDLETAVEAVVNQWPNDVDASPESFFNELKM
ncbi:hypothetical protein ANN_07447 [Periplaneta americana]|uniref:Ig-like domain-containing protein n=1 Tax=Periplaneta americana TaxID=6978 RepID=A0ABQ8T068_PERAM|nr:hypothetical protein ANN_07447 [Periplaneta americana]